MTDRRIEKHDGAWVFHDETIMVEVRDATIDSRTRHIVGDVVVRTPDGAGVLGQHRGWVTDTVFRLRLAQAVASRNSGDSSMVDTVLLAVELELEEILRPTAPLDITPYGDWRRSVSTDRNDVVAELFERRGVYAQTGRSKAGKTVTAMNLVAAASGHGCEWLGHSIVRNSRQPLRVQAIFAEDPPRVIARRFDRMALGQDLDGLTLHVGEFSLTERNIESVTESLRGVDLIYADPLVVVADIADLNDAVIVRRGLSLWRQLAAELDAVILLNHHNRKSADGDRTDVILGSVQIMAALDGVLQIDAVKGLAKDERRIHYEGRDWPPRDDLIIKLDAETLTWWPAGSFQERKSRDQAAQRAEDQRGLWKLLPEDGSGLTLGEVAAMAPWGRDKCRSLLKQAPEGTYVVTGIARSRSDPQRWARGNEPQTS